MGKQIDTAGAAADMQAFERAARLSGFARIAGVDEAGRGPLAGPIVAGAVVLSGSIHGLNDSKLLTESRREVLFQTLQEGLHAIGIGVITASEIDRLGIQQANYLAMAKAAAALDPPPDFLLVDGFAIKGCDIPQKPIIKGDRRSFSIAAASIVAKVTRDRMMKDLDNEYPGYGFAKHKGYGTPGHLEALQRLGPCPFHRKSFAPIARWLETKDLFQPKDVPA